MKEALTKADHDRLTAELAHPLTWKPLHRRSAGAPDARLGPHTNPIPAKPTGVAY